MMPGQTAPLGRGDHRRDEQHAPASPVLELRGVSRVHGEGEQTVTALRGVSMSIRPGEFVAIMGPSGSGKSTLLHLAGGLDVPTSGAVLIEGQPMERMSAAERALMRRRSIGYVFQDYNLLPSLTAVENVAFPLELDGWNARRARRAASIELERVGLAELADRLPQDMSGGQQQRVAVARALVGQRRLLLADEVTGALDSTTGRIVMGLLRERADAGAAIMLVTHEPRFASWADRTLFLRDGSLTGIATPSDLDRELSTMNGGHR